MSGHTTDAIVVHCIDFRFQKYLDPWLSEHFGHDNFDRVSLAGGVFDFFAVLRQVEISDRLHKIKKVVLVNHEDCGAYGKEGNYARHKADLEEAERKIEALFPNLDVEIYYLHLDGEFEKLSRTNPA
ncbi:MAG: carbonic anhydrase [Chloroflexota bacterium]